MDLGMNGDIRIWWHHLLWLGIIENRRKVAKRRQVELMLLPSIMWFATLGTRPESESLPFNESLIECFSCRYDESWIKSWERVLKWSLSGVRSSDSAFWERAAVRMWIFHASRKKRGREMKVSFKQVQGNVHSSLLCLFFFYSFLCYPSPFLCSRFKRVEAKYGVKPLLALCPKLMHSP